ncbi:MAG: phosphatidylinositol-specific phospholipase C/glycerophosphodiester phosphodiesterase family protein [Chitinophagales bacterium]|nr:phosphatidylinositol-specific phospholipase C/glycerophosphodiester phosphodiesterase family protein [Chitinophagales bacterium]
MSWRIHFPFLFSFFLLFSCHTSSKIIPGHAHNDYEHSNPLQDALKHHFLSVEVDVHLIDGSLYVSHDLPAVLDSNRTLGKMYLQPLQQHVKANDGNVYTDYTGPFYLMVDVKTEAESTYQQLIEVLSNYEDIVRVASDKTAAPLTVFVSGNRAIQTIIESKFSLAVLDGRPVDLDKNISYQYMPVVSDNFYNVLSWDGVGDISKEDRQKLKQLVEAVHTQNKKLRLWAAPDNEQAWEFLLDSGVDLINTDRIGDFYNFYKTYK